MDISAIVHFLQSVAAPLSYELMFGAIVAGLVIGAFYNRRANIPRRFVYHKAVTGVSFILFLYSFRAMTVFFTGGVVANPAGWLGIAVLWIIFCFFIWLGQAASDSHRRAKYERDHTDFINKEIQHLEEKTGIKADPLHSEVY
jgi:hypothetical protein